jgi:3-oxoacyl-[acyl-carrier-protein] synthase-3
MSRFAAIVGTGHYVPERVVDNAEISRILGEDVGAWLVDNVGIHRRCVMAPEQRTSDLAILAAERAMRVAKIGPGELDLILVATDTPDQMSPATAAVVQAGLRARRAGAFDLNAACAGWVTALDMGSKAIAADSGYRHVLVVGAYGMTRFVDWKDKYTATLFADGAGAVVLRASDAPGFLGARLAAFGEYHDALGVYTGGTARPATLENVTEGGPPRVQFVRKFPASFNVEHWPRLVTQVLDEAAMVPGDVDLFVFTQLNLRSIEATMRALGQPMERTHWTMDKWGYTGSACIPMTLDDAIEQGKLRRGQHVVFCASGGGVSMAAALFRWTH